MATKHSFSDLKTRNKKVSTHVEERHFKGQTSSMIPKCVITSLTRTSFHKQLAKIVAARR